MSSRIAIYRIYKNGYAIDRGTKFYLSKKYGYSPYYINQLSLNHKTTKKEFNIEKIGWEQKVYSVMDGNCLIYESSLKDVSEFLKVTEKKVTECNNTDKKLKGYTIGTHFTFINSCTNLTSSRANRRSKIRLINRYIKEIDTELENDYDMKKDNEFTFLLRQCAKGLKELRSKNNG